MNPPPNSTGSSTSLHLSPPSASTSTLTTSSIQPSTSNVVSNELERLLEVVDEQVLKAYRDKYIPFQVIQACPTIYSFQNALKWVNLDKFAYFVAQYYQERSPPPSSPYPSPVPTSVVSSSTGFNMNIPTTCIKELPFSTPLALALPTTTTTTTVVSSVTPSSYAYPTPASSAYADIICGLVEDTSTSTSTMSIIPQKRSRSAAAAADANATAEIASTSASNHHHHDRSSTSQSQSQSPRPPQPQPVLKRQPCNTNTKQAQYSAAGYVQLTRQSWVNRLEYLTEIPLHWRVPASGESVAYLLDLSDCCPVVSPVPVGDDGNGKSKFNTVSALIKQKCTDAWSGGSGGSITKATTVSILGSGVKCQKMVHDCRGVFLCSRVDPDLWKDYACEDRSENVEYPLFASASGSGTSGGDGGSSLRAGTDALEVEDGGDGDGGASVLERERFEHAVRFYNTMVKEKCLGENGNCAGKLVFKSYDAITLQYPGNPPTTYIGCSAIPFPNQPTQNHFYHEIPSDVDHTLLLKLYTMNRVNLSDTLVFQQSCTFTVPPRTGHKQKNCPHIHVENGEMFEGTMWQRPCPAKITIMVPINREIRKAVVIPTANIPHNHPFCSWDKRTRVEKAAARRVMHDGAVEVEARREGSGAGDIDIDEDGT